MRRTVGTAPPPPPPLRPRWGDGRVVASAATTANTSHMNILLKSVGAVIVLTACIPWLLLNLIPSPFHHVRDRDDPGGPPPPPRLQRRRDLRPPSLTGGGGGGGGGDGNNVKNPVDDPADAKPSKLLEATRKKAVDDPRNAKPPEGAKSPVYHFVVSSDCSTYQRWQVLTQIHSANAVRQSGRFTWIVSGCPDEEGGEGVDGDGRAKQSDGKDATSPRQIEADLASHFPEETSPSLHPITAHFTPDYADMSVYGGPYADGKKKRTFTNREGKIQYGNYGNHYHFNNKPNGLRNWAEHRFNHDGDDKSIEDEVIILIDPDFLFLKPFELPSDVTVSPGRPAAAHYGLGGQWLDFDLTAICGPTSPCTHVTNADVNAHYTAGPPYVVHSSDVLRLSKRWSELVPPTYDQYPLLYAEMYAYSMAAADLSLPHTLVRGSLFTGCMVRYPQDKRQAELSAKTFVDGGFDLHEEGNNVGASSCFVDGHVPPVFLHYCRRYAFENPNYGGRGGKEEKEKGEANDNGEPPYYFFAKRRVPHDILDRDCPPRDDGGNNSGGDDKNGVVDTSNLTPFPSFQNERIDGGRMDWTTLTACSVLRAVNHARRSRCDARDEMVE